MGLLGKNKTCTICGKEGSGAVYADGFACRECSVQAGAFFRMEGMNAKKQSIDTLKQAIARNSENNRRLQVFHETKRVWTYIVFDEHNKLWYIPDLKSFKSMKRVYSYEEIRAYEILEDGDTVSKGGLGRAIVGGMTFGGVGAIVGGATGKRKSKKLITKLQVKITVDDIADPAVYIDFLSKPAKTASSVYKKAFERAQELMSVLAVIDNENNQNKNQSSFQNSEISEADEIMKFKQLLDEGIITEEEFEAKKKELLGR